MWMIFGREKSGAQARAVQTLARFLCPLVVRRGFQVHASFCPQAGVRLQKIPQQHCIERDGN
jgi:hypothetical protein